MMETMQNNEESTTSPETKNDTHTAEHLIQNHPKRLAKTQNETFYNDNAAAYIIVIRNNNSKSRIKRSSEYATLEPIDEDSLSALRKTYKNSLKEITLNPNETPAEAIMRYNAESIREALENANKQPMELSAGEEDEEAKENDTPNEMDQHQLLKQPQLSNSLPQSYAVNENGQLAPITIPPQASVYNQPLSAPFNPPHALVYDPAAHQENNYNNMISKYPTTGVYSNNNKFAAQNPYLPVSGPLKPLPYRDNYNVVNQPYQFSNRKPADDTENAANSLAYQNYLQHLSKQGHLIRGYDNYPGDFSSTKIHHTVPHLPNKNTYIDAYNPSSHSQTQVNPSFTSGGPQNSPSFERIIDHIKQQLSECCNKCKDNIFKSVDATLKHQQYGVVEQINILPTNTKNCATFSDKPHALTYRENNKDEDIEYKQWLAEMSDKGYNKDYLTKQHQQDYIREGRLNLYIQDDQDLRRGVQNIFVKNNASFKRETTLPATEMEPIKEAEPVTALIKNEQKIEKPKEEENVVEGEEEEQEEEEEEYEVEPEEDDGVVVANENPISVEAEGITPNPEMRNQTESKTLEPTNQTVYPKSSSNNEILQTSSTPTTMETAESTTQSIYALRGQFRSHKVKPTAFSLKQGKHFGNYKNIKKLNSANSIPKSNDKENSMGKSHKPDEKVEKSYDPSSPKKVYTPETSTEENFTTTISISYATTSAPAISSTKPLKSSPANIIANTSTTNNVGKPKKADRKRSKSQKLANSSPNLATPK